jgi:hypothetical protein
MNNREAHTNGGIQLSTVLLGWTFCGGYLWGEGHRDHGSESQSSFIIVQNVPGVRRTRVKLEPRGSRRPSLFIKTMVFDKERNSARNNFYRQSHRRKKDHNRELGDGQDKGHVWGRHRAQRPSNMHFNPDDFELQSSLGAPRCNSMLCQPVLRTVRNHFCTVF